MKQTVYEIIQKINFIETDIEIHKQILISIPTGQDKEMEEVIEKIASLTEKVKKLKSSIKDIDPEEHNKIMQFEKASKEFKKIVKGKKLKNVTTLDNDDDCKIRLKDGQEIQCLVKAQEESGRWIVMTINGETHKYSIEEVEK